jgi:hypothetical protein
MPFLRLIEANMSRRHLKGNGCPSKPRWETVEGGIEERVSINTSKAKDFV